MAPKPGFRGTAATDAETLASASGRNVQEFLSRAHRRRSKVANGEALHAAYQPPAAADAAPACGASAVATGDHCEERLASNNAGSAVDLASLLADRTVGSAEWDGDWEDMSGDDDGALGAHNPPSAAPSTGGDDLIISLRAGGVRGAGHDAAAPQRRAFTKDDREAARLVHRSHLLCLLGRGLLFDAAAEDVMLLALLLSLTPPDVAAPLATPGGCALSSLAAALEWFRGHFNLAATSGAQQLTTPVEDEVAAAMERAEGVPGVSRRLHAAVAQRCGSAEELAALFAALLRAHGVRARTVRLLEPSSIKPGDALRQQERVMAAYMKRPARRNAEALASQGEARGGSSSFASAPRSAGGNAAMQQAAVAATELLTGDATRKRQKYVTHLASQLGVPSAAFKLVGGGVELDPRKLKRGKGSRNKASAAQPAAGEGCSKNLQPPVRSKRPGGRAPHLAGEVRPGPAAAVPRKAAPSGRARKRKAAPAAAEPGPATEPSGTAVPLGSVAEVAAAPPRRQRNKGEDEFQRELELAMAATAFAAPPPGASNEGEPRDGSEAIDDGALGGEPKRTNGAGEQAAGGARRRGGQPRGSAHGAAFGAHQADVGRFWVEAYCGGGADGRWVHADPVSGWLDRAADVEGLAPRAQAIAYVVAFAGSGAKDVTRRYTSSFLSAEKQREGGWWEDTLRPLRLKEVAAGCAGGEGTEAGGSSLAKEASGKRSGSAAAPDVAAAREDRELEARAAVERRGLPTTIDGFRTHATFVLKRHIGRYQALKPGSKVMGMHRGEGYHLREDLGEVHTAERWRRLGREVLAGELGQPAKMMKTRGAKDTPPRTGTSGRDCGDLDDDGNELEGGGGGGNGQAMSSFYGEWQTKEWEQPGAVGGKVPRNERGNVEVPPFTSALPPGTAHVRLPNAGAVCRRLGIDYAPALTGFEIRAGRSVPSLEGVVVCAEHEEAVRAAHEEEQRRKAGQARVQRAAAAAAAWRLLLRSLLTRVQLEISYGDGTAPEGAMAEAAAALLHDTHGEPAAVQRRAKQRRTGGGIGGGEEIDLTEEAEAPADGGGGANLSGQQNLAGVKVEEI